MRPIILYDGQCALCSGAVKTVLRLDDEGVFVFAPLESRIAEKLLMKHELDRDKIDSVVLVDQSGAYIKSDAFFRCMRILGWPYRAVNLFQVLPKGIRDGVYDFVARNRYAVFGKHESCWMPQAVWKGRFIED